MERRTRWYIAGASLGITLPVAALLTWCHRVVYGPPDTALPWRDAASPEPEQPAIAAPSIDAGAPVAGGALLLAIALAFPSCTKKPPSADIGSAPRSHAAPDLAPSPNSEEAVLKIENDPQVLRIEPISEAKQREACAKSTSDGKFVLEVPEGTFPKIEEGTYFVREAATRKPIVVGQGWDARWVSRSEVAYLDASGHLTKFDIIDPKNVTHASSVCGSVLECEPHELPRLDWVSSGLEYAVLRDHSDNEPFVYRKGQVAKLASELQNEHGFRVVAFSPSGALSVIVNGSSSQRRSPWHRRASSTSRARRVGQLETTHTQSGGSRTTTRARLEHSSFNAKTKPKCAPVG